MNRQPVTGPGVYRLFCATGVLPVSLAMCEDPTSERQLRSVVHDPQARFDRSAKCPDGIDRCTLSDNGCGFDKAHTDKLFEPFSRALKECEFTGAGIGLALVPRIVNRNLC